MVINKYLAELVGTFILVLLGSMSITAATGALNPDLAAPLILVVGLGWLFLFNQDKGSPLIRAWNWTIYKPPTFAWLRGIPRGRINWVLHLVVFYAFAGMLTGFLVGNLNNMGHVGWASAGLNFGSVSGALHGLTTMLTTVPHTTGIRETFSLVRVGLMTLCVAGCLIGYWHTLFSVFWKPNAIKNIDFTVWGWLANGFCYGPLFHGAVLIVSAHPVGLEPAVTDGGFYWLSQVVEQLMNLLYTLSILNLGTRFGVMVDKGVQENGFYSVVRHPSYTLEPFMFLVLHLARLNSPAAWLGHMIWPLKYYFRSERDDMFMSESNPDYVAYKKKTKWKFIPGWY